MPLAKAQTKLEKQNIHFVERQFLSLTKILQKKLLPYTKFHWNWAIGCWVSALKHFLIWRPSTILKFKKIHIWSHDSQSVPNMHLCNKIIETGRLKLRYCNFTICKNSHLWSCDCHRVPNVLLCTKFHQNPMIFHWHMANLWFSRWLISAMLNFRGPIMGSLKSPCRTSYRSLIETTLKLLSFWENHIFM